MKTYTRWDTRGNAELPYSVIIDTEEMEITELSLSEFALARQDIQKIVPDEGWLRGLYDLVEGLRRTTAIHNELIEDHYDKAKWVKGGGCVH